MNPTKAELPLSNFVPAFLTYAMYFAIGAFVTSTALGKDSAIWLQLAGGIAGCAACRLLSRA